MKRLLIGPLLCALLLCACQASGEASEATQYASTLAKAQTIQIQDARGQVVETLTQEGEIETFLQNLFLEHWTYQPLPEGAEPLGTFRLIQEETIHLGESQPQDWTEVCRLTLYPDHLLTLELLGLTLPFDVGEAAGEALEHYL